MERLTEWNGEQTRHAYYPRCFEKPCYGDGCKIKGCPFQEAVCDRLAAYEDTELTPEEIKAPLPEDTMINLAAQALGVEPSRLREIAEAREIEKTLSGYDYSISRMVELMKADVEGRVLILPCNGYSDIEIVRNGISYKPDHWNIHLTAFAHGQNTPSGLKVGLFDIGEVERAMEEMEGKKDG